MLGDAPATLGRAGAGGAPGERSGRLRAMAQPGAGQPWPCPPRLCEPKGLFSALRPAVMDCPTLSHPARHRLVNGLWAAN